MNERRGVVDWGARLARMVEGLERRFDSALGGIGLSSGVPDPIAAFVYRGFGTPERVRVMGRVLEIGQTAPAGAGDPRWRNVFAAIGRFESDEIPGARVAVRYGAARRELVADDEGYFTGWIDGSAPDPTGSGWRRVAVDLLSPDGVGSEGQVLVPSPAARVGIISDLDDTVIRTGVRRLIRMLASTFLENARTRLPFPGVAAFYQALHAGPPGTAPSPIFYVSSSPWNMHDFLLEFMEVRGIPAGPLLLRDWSMSRQTFMPRGHHSHKTDAIELLFSTYPELPFILIGDSGQQDPEIYREMAARHPGRVPAIYIRDVTANPIRSAQVRELASEIAGLGSRMLLVEDTLAAARHAAEHGWIAPERVAAVEREIRAAG
ncbi:MAG TPA: phosphatase domain-containing protein [Gemmatimonadales bacterium]